MKTLYIEARSKKQIPLNNLGRIKEKKIGLISTIQHLSQLPRVKAELENQGKKVFLAKGILTKYKGQILGCDVSAGLKIADKVQAFLYLGTGEFHPLALALKIKTEKPIYLLSPNGELELFPQKKVEKFFKQKKAAYLHFLHENRIGIIVSIKPGQENLKTALFVKEKLQRKGKKAFIFLCDAIPFDELENFKCNVWINTACPGLQFEKNFLNVADISDFLNS